MASVTSVVKTVVAIVVGSGVTAKFVSCPYQERVQNSNSPPVETTVTAATGNLDEQND